MRDETRAAFDRIADLFFGTDGGVSFCRFEDYLDQLDEQADTDPAAQEAIAALHAFDRLIADSQPKPDVSS